MGLRHKPCHAEAGRGVLRRRGVAGSDMLAGLVSRNVCRCLGHEAPQCALCVGAASCVSKTCVVSTVPATISDSLLVAVRCGSVSQDHDSCASATCWA